MKKLALLIGCVFTFASCEVEDEGPRVLSEYAEVTEIDLPESFEEGETYEIEVTYLLPSACHQPAGREASRGSTTGDERRDIYVAGVATYTSDMGECDVEDEDLEETSSFSITIDETEPYTFYLWKGVDVDNKPVFTTVEVPVTETEETTQE